MWVQLECQWWRRLLLLTENHSNDVWRHAWDHLVIGPYVAAGVRRLTRPSDVCAGPEVTYVPTLLLLAITSYDVTSYVRPTTHVLEIGAEHPYQKTGIINRHENIALSYSLPKTGTRKIRNRFSGTGFRRRFLIRMSLALQPAKWWWWWWCWRCFMVMLLLLLLLPDCRWPCYKNDKTVNFWDVDVTRFEKNSNRTQLHFSVRI